MSESEPNKKTGASNISRKNFLKHAGGAIAGATTLGFIHFDEKEQSLGSKKSRFFSAENHINAKDIVIENDEIQLVITPEGIGKSLVYKPTGAECLMDGVDIPVFSMVQYHPYSGTERANLIPLEEHEFKAKSVTRKGNKLIIGFDIVDIYAVINLNIKPQYIEFSVEGFSHSDEIKVKGEADNVTPSVPQVDEMWFLQLPVRNGSHFGQWLNVMWNDELAVNVLGTGPYTRIVSEKGDGYRTLKAGLIKEVKSKGVGAGLIATSTDKLLDVIGQVEEDFKLPHGARNRKSEKANSSTYWTSSITPDNVDEHIKYAKKAGFQTFQIFYPAFARTVGHFEWQKAYPNGMKDLQTVVSKIEKAGMIPGIHIHYDKASKNDKYVTPVPDHRFNLRQYFTLSQPLEKGDTTIFVEENPHDVTLQDGRRILKIGDELISYTDYASESRPFKFTGCTRGALGTQAASHVNGEKFGLLDVDTWIKFVRFDQQTSIQEEVAERFADMYKKAGFKFVYLDGAEDINKPYWFNCPKAQWEVYKRLEPEPIFAGGAAMTHFSWHMLSRGNSWDKFSPRIMKKATKNYPAVEAPLMEDNFTRSAFGWMANFVPGEDGTIGTQPDMYEYVASLASGWDSPYLLTGDVEKLEAHPRTPDNIEVIRRWNDVRAKNWLTEKQKRMLRNADQEHILLLNEQQNYELVPYEQIENKSKEVRAFIFERKNKWYVVYWHTSGSKKLKLPVKSEDVRLYEELGQQATVSSDQSNDSAVLPVSHRRYLRADNLTKKQLITAFQDAVVTG